MSRRPVRPRWALIAGAAVVCLGGAVAAAPFVIPVERYRPLLEQTIRSATGRDVQIGSLRLWLVPTVRIQARDVRLLNPRGFPPGEAVAVRAVDIGVEPRALLFSRRLVITSVGLDGVRVNVLADAGGRTNYDLPVPPRRAAPPGAGSAQGSVPPQGAAGGSWFSVGPIGQVTARLVDVGFGAVAAGGRPTARGVMLTGMAATVRSADPAAPNWLRRLEINVALRGASLQTPALTKPIQIQSGTFVVKNGSGQGTFVASLDGMRATGTLRLADLDPPLITFGISIPELDAGRLRRLMSGTGPGPARASPGPRRLVARGDVGVDRLIFAPFQISRIRTRLGVFTDSLHVDSYTLSAYGGTVIGVANVAFAASGLPVTATAAARGIDLAQLTGIFSSGAPKVTGALDANLLLATTLGQNPEAALTGAGTFAARNGSLPGFALTDFMVHAVRSLGVNAPSGPTRFSYFGGDLRIAGERVYSTALRFVSDALDGMGRGSVGFDRSLDYTGTGILKAVTPGAAGTSSGSLLSGLLPSAGKTLGALAAGASGAQVPFSIGGTFDAPRFALTGSPQWLRGAPTQGSRSPQPPPALSGLPSLPGFLKVP